jgi:hypothetical protein
MNSSIVLVVRRGHHGRIIGVRRLPVLKAVPNYSEIFGKTI